MLPEILPIQVTLSLSHLLFSPTSDCQRLRFSMHADVVTLQIDVLLLLFFFTLGIYDPEGFWKKIK